MCTDQPAAPYKFLPTTDGILLWAIRAWVLRITEKLPVEEQVRDAFSRLGAPDAPDHVFAFIWSLGLGACRTIDVRCVCSQEISEDERHLLTILALGQQGRRLETMFLLRAMMRPASSGAALDAAVEVGACLRRAGLCLSQRLHGTTRHVLGPPTSSEAGMPSPFVPTIH